MGWVKIFSNSAAGYRGGEGSLSKVAHEPHWESSVLAGASVWPVSSSRMLNCS